MHDSAVSYLCSVLSDINARISPSCEKLSRAKLLPVLSASSLIEFKDIDPDDPPDARRVKFVNEFLLSSLPLLLEEDDDEGGFSSFHLM